jgi:hypothetical protein
LTSGTAVKSKSEIVRRWGTRSPLLNVAVTITYLSPDVDGTDTGNFTPVFTATGSLNHFAAFGAPAFTGTLLAVTAKSVVGNAALSSTFTTTTGAMAANLVLVNTTRGNSRGIAVRNLGAGNWLITQPFAGPYVAGTNPVITEVDTWANGDAIQGFVPLAVDLGVLGGSAQELNQTSVAPQHVVQQITLFDPSTLAPNISTLYIDVQAYPLLIDCVVQRNISMGGRSVQVVATRFIGVACVAGFDGTSGCNQLVMSGGYLGTAGSGIVQMRGITLRDDLIILNNNATNFYLDISVTGAVFLDAGSVVNGRVLVNIFGTGKFYGSGIFNQQAGTCSFLASTGAVATFNGVTLKLAGALTGYSNATPAPGAVTVVHGGIALTATNLDAAAGAAGFGKYAFGGGAVFCGTGVQP